MGQKDHEDESVRKLLKVLYALGNSGSTVDKFKYYDFWEKNSNIVGEAL